MKQVGWSSVGQCFICSEFVTRNVTVLAGTFIRLQSWGEFNYAAFNHHNLGGMFQCCFGGCLCAGH